MEINSKGNGPGRAKRISAPRERGVALIMVLGFIIVLAVMAAAFATNMQVEVKLARKANDDVKVEWICRSGIELSKYILAQQMANNAQEPYDSLNQKWAGYSGDDTDGDPNDNSGDPGFNPFLDNLDLNNSAWAENSMLGLMFPDQNEFEEEFGASARCSIQIVDLERKYNINWAADGDSSKFPLQKAFELMGVDTGLSPYLIDAIKDWRDIDDNRRVTGAESDNYEAKTPPYTAKNGPIDDLSELLLVEGITPEIYWGSRTKQIAANPLQSPSAGLPGAEEDEENTYNFGMVDIFTSISRGKININTASTNVIMLVPGYDEGAAAAIQRERSGLDGIEGNWDDTPFDTMEQVVGVAFPRFTQPSQIRVSVSNANQYFSLQSVTFEVTVQAQVGKLSRTLVAVISRASPTDIKILYTYWK